MTVSKDLMPLRGFREAIERYHIKDGSWELLHIKLKFPLSNCACFCPQKNKVIVFGGGFSSGFSPFVE